MKYGLKFAILSLAVALCSAAWAPIFRPCHVQNHQCIGEVMSSNSLCQDKVPGSMPEWFITPEFKFETPHFNATYVEKDLKVSNMGQCKVAEFFVNSETDNVVLGIDCPDLEFEAERIMYQHWVFHEDTTYNYHFDGTYPSLRITVQMKNSPQMDLCNENSTNVFTYVTDLPYFKINPNDQQTSDFLDTDLSRLYIYERETFLYRGPKIARYFINNMLCNFGCY